MREKDFVWKPATWICENGKYLASISDDLVITGDEIREETKTAPINFNEKNATSKTKNFYILLAFLLITIALLIAVSIYCYNVNQNKNIHYHIMPQITN